MTPQEIRNERLKLFANWLNTLGAAIITAGTFVSAAQFIFGLLPKDTDNGLVVGMALTSIAGGFVLHLFGQLTLAALR
ncbi:hypothetical protein [Bradyrhizobium sp. 179]|uniref:hypothetical protein n=1 Tax=Bradyrhizobium sp. 179 TaxID=2782648 RepID=UPI001FFC115F|nr:hypothetical protein [Bradyrhizobium sp. 179]